MKSFFLILALFASASATTFVSNKALQVRGGAKLGPLDSDMALKLSKTAATAYVAGSGSKYINSQTGGTDSQLATFVTGDLFQLQALITAVACAMFKLGGTGFDSMNALAVGSLVALALRLQSDGISVDTLKSNAIQAVIAVLLSVIAFVE